MAAIVASTSFLSGTFIFRDTVQRTFNALFADVFERVEDAAEPVGTTIVDHGVARTERLRPAVGRRHFRDDDVDEVFQLLARHRFVSRSRIFASRRM